MQFHLATYADHYCFRNLQVLGRVMAGEGGDLILSLAAQVLREEFPEVAEQVRFHAPDEKEKRHGQAIAAASLPAADHYCFRNQHVLGRVMTGEGGDLILSLAAQVLREEFPEVAEQVRFHIPDEKEKRHGQAIAAASLPALD